MEFVSDGLRISYRDDAPLGDDRGEAVLLIHGFASSAEVNWVGTGWFDTLRRDGRRTIAFDHRGHGSSDKPHDPARYATGAMAQDALRLLDHLEITRADVIGYSMGARVAAFLALASPHRVRSIVIGGLGNHLVEGGGLPIGIADAMEALFPRRPDRSDTADVQALRRSRRQRSRGSRGLYPGVAPEPLGRRGRQDRNAGFGRGRDEGSGGRGSEPARRIAALRRCAPDPGPRSQSGGR